MQKQYKFKKLSGIQLERFLSLVDKTSHCWNWKGVFNVYGYGLMHVNGPQIKAHRISYQEFNGPLDEKLVIDHICRNRACVNPKHLRQTTIKQNVLSGEGLSAINLTKDFCVREHPLLGVNLYLHKNKRQCKECRKIRADGYKKNRLVGRFSEVAESKINNKGAVNG